MPEPRIEIELRQWEWEPIAKEPVGNGGFQRFIRELQARAEPKGTGMMIPFDRAQVGDLIFHLGYGHQGSRGGYQSRLRKAFAAPLARWLGMN